MFEQCNNLKELILINNFNTINVTDLKGMFQGCNELEYLDLSIFNTSNVKDMQKMFNKCRNLKEIKGINNFNTINVTNMKDMFAECCKIKNLEIANFNTSKVINMSKMFLECYELNFLDISNFDISKVKNFEYMFYKCYKLKEIKGIKIFTTINITGIKGMFEDCPILEKSKELMNILNNLEKKEVKKINIVKKQIKVNFKTTDQFIEYSTSCYNTDIFSTIEEELYQHFPQLKYRDIVFLCKGNKVNNSLTLEENHIKNDDIILINDFED